MRRLAAVDPELSDEDLLALRRAPSPQDAPGPWVRAVFVSSLDGATALDGRSGTLGSPADRRQFALARTDADVILVGAGTVRAEGYAGPLVDAAARARRAARGLPEHPAVAVVTGSLDLDPDGEFFRAAPVRPWVIASERAVADRPERAQEDLVVESGPSGMGNGTRLLIGLGGLGLIAVLVGAAMRTNRGR